MSVHFTPFSAGQFVEGRRRQGVLRLAASSGAFDAVVLEPAQRTVHDLAVDGSA